MARRDKIPLIPLFQRGMLACGEAKSPLYWIPAGVYPVHGEPVQGEPVHRYGAGMTFRGIDTI